MEQNQIKIQKIFSIKVLSLLSVSVFDRCCFALL